jgi:trehalose/maltose transport system permease protein
MTDSAAQAQSGAAMTAAVAATAPRGRLREEAPRATWAKARERLAWIMVAPSLAVVGFIALYPLFQTFHLSLTNARFGSARAEEYVGFANYERILSDSDFINALVRTFQFTITSVILETLLGIAIALVINTQFKGRGLVRTAMLLPWAIMTVVSAQLWKYMLDQNAGVVNDILVTRLGLLDEKVAWTSRLSTTLWSLVAIDVWKTTPFMALLLLAGLQVIPGDVYEASYVDGATKVQQFFQITLPLLKPALLVALIFRTLDAFKVFDLPYVTTGASPSTQTVAVYAQQTLVNDLRLGRSSAASVIIFLIIGAMVILYTRFVKIEEG